MKAIGPYVVVRELTAPPVALARAGAAQADPHPETHTAGGQRTGGQTLWVTDRLTGMPALLHEVAQPLSVLPQLPLHPALLTPSDQLIEQGRIFVVTELPLGAAPAQDPLLAARAALSGLDALHTQGLAHGTLGPGQLWSADGQVMLTGAGLHPLDGDHTVARDLHDLALTLEALGGLPPELALLRAAPERLSAREALALLGGEPQAPLPTPGTALPPLHTMSLLGGREPLPQRSTFVQQAAPGLGDLPSGGQPPARVPGASEPLDLDLAEWTVPDFLAPTTASPIEQAADLSGPQATAEASRPAGPATGLVLDWATPNRAGPQTPGPGTETAPRRAVPGDTLPLAPRETVSGDTVSGQPATEPPAPEPPASKPPDAEPPAPEQPGAARRALSRLKADASQQSVRAQTRQDAAGSPPEAQAPATAGLTPQERRRQWTQAQLQAQAEAQHGDTLPVRPPYPPLQPDAGAAQPVNRRTLKPMRATLGDDGQWKVQRGEAGQSAEARPTAPLRPPAWRLPPWAARVRPWVWAVALAALVLLVTLLALALGRGGRSAQRCCAVQFAVQGGAQGQATLTLEDVPSGSSDQPGRVLGQVPGTVRFAGQGRYVLRVSTPGFTPADLTLDVPPAAQPVTINLKP